MRWGRTWLRSSRQPSLAMKRFQTWHSSSVRGVPWACAHARMASSVLAGEHAALDLRVGDAEETAAASVEGEEFLVAEVIVVSRRELARGVEADFVQHPPEINEAPDFIVATAQTRNVRHEQTSVR